MSPLLVSALSPQTITAPGRAIGGMPWLATPCAVGQEFASQPRRSHEQELIPQQLLQEPWLLPPKLGGGPAERLRMMLSQVIRQAGHLLWAHLLRIGRVQPWHPLPQLVRIGTLTTCEAPQ